MDYPARNTYRLLAGIGQVLEERNIKHPDEHIIAIRSWSAVTFLVKKSGFSKNQEKQVIQFCNDLMFDPLILPDSNEINREKYNILEDKSFFMNIERLLSSDKKEFLDAYPFRVRPATDNRPFFFQNIRWSGVHQLIASFGESSIPFFELGYVLILFTFIQIVVIAGIFIILPFLSNHGKAIIKCGFLCISAGLAWHICSLRLFLFSNLPSISANQFMLWQQVSASS